MTDFNPKTIKPSRSVPIRFIGRVIAETEWTTNRGAWMRFTVWETRGGAYIAVTDGSVPDKPDQIEVTATVVEAMYKPGTVPAVTDGIWKPGIPLECRDETAMQIAVIEFFEGHDRAKQMLKNTLGWSPFRIVE